MSSTFELLHEKVQRYIALQRWQNFRPIQDDAIQKLLVDKTNLLICAPTASGKTEAAFLPIISSIVNNQSSSIRAIYVSPLKALINDQFRRLSDMCNNIGIPVTKWHGDASATQKAKIVNDPAGILLITPESLEAVLLNKSLSLNKMFCDLGWIVIDEIHSFAGVERGAQLRSLIARIEAESGMKPLRIGLSATIGNPDEVAKWMTTEPYEIIEDRSWRDFDVEGMISGFRFDVVEDDIIYKESNPSEGILFSFLKGKNLIFGNSKARLEEVSDELKSLAKEKSVATEFLIHHGSLSKNTREDAEDKIKHFVKPVSILCTSTMEMGLDIGAIEKIGFIDSPWAVSSFTQRLGRSGRREGHPKKFEFFIRQQNLAKDAKLDEIYRESLIKSIAVVLLYTKSYIEPLNTHKLNYSTLLHQLLSHVTHKGGATKEDLFLVIVTNGFRGNLSKERFDKLIDYLVETKFLFRESNGILSAGKHTQSMTEYYDFYSVFKTPQEWEVIFSGEVIGQIPASVQYSPGDRIILAGRKWDIHEVHDQSMRLLVKPGRDAKAPKFLGSFGITHKEVHQMMKSIYESEEIYPFLDPVAKDLLKEARGNYKKLRDNTLIIPIFEGSIIQNTVLLGLKLLKINCKGSECFIKVSDPEWKVKLVNLVKDPNVYSIILQSMNRELKMLEKFDEYLPNEMLDEVYGQNMIDINGLREVLTHL